MNKLFLITLLMISVVACTLQKGVPPTTSVPVSPFPTDTFTPTPPNQYLACFLPIPPDNVVVQPSPSPRDVTTLENEGYICFYSLSQSAFDVQVASSGCYPTGCTLIFERTGNMEVDQDTLTIQFSSRYVIKDVGNVRESGAVCECAADCNGAGNLRFQTKELQDGIYSIKLGKTQIGQLVVPFYGNDICWSTESIYP